jgi:hypothetical protein
VNGVPCDHRAGGLRHGRALRAGDERRLPGRARRPDAGRVDPRRPLRRPGLAHPERLVPPERHGLSGGRPDGLGPATPERRGPRIPLARARVRDTPLPRGRALSSLVYFRLHVVGETWLWAAALHLVLTFPYAHRWRRFAWVPYAVAAVVLAIYQLWLYDASVYSRVVLFNYSAIGLAAVAFFVRLVWEALQGHSGLVRQRVRVLLVGTLVGFALPGAAIAVPAMLGGDVSMNLPSALNFVFALTIAYAIVKHDLFEIDAMVKRGAYYALLTGAVGTAYVGAVLLFNLGLRAGAVTESPAFPVVFTLAVLLFFNPLRSRLQALVDRLFYRTRYDGARVLADAGSALSSALTRDDIARLVRGRRRHGHSERRRSPLGGDREDDGGVCEVGGSARLPGVARPAARGGPHRHVLRRRRGVRGRHDAPGGARRADGHRRRDRRAPPSSRRARRALTVGPKRSGPLLHRRGRRVSACPLPPGGDRARERAHLRGAGPPERDARAAGPRSDRRARALERRAGTGAPRAAGRRGATGSGGEDGVARATRRRHRPRDQQPRELHLDQRRAAQAPARPGRRRRDARRPAHVEGGGRAGRHDGARARIERRPS